MNLEFDLTVKFIERPDKFLVYFSEEGDIFETNKVGKYIILGIRAGKTIEQINEGLVKETGEDVSRIRKDVDEFIQTLKSRKILK
jgi:hydrogenase maturation factor